MHTEAHKALLVRIAEELYEADHTGKPIEQITKRHQGLNIQDAYAIQLLNKDRALTDGKHITGKKIGRTSLAMQQSLGVDQPDFGFLYDSMDATHTGAIPNGALQQPRVEGELAFVLKAPLKGKVTAEEVRAATAYVVPAIEVVASRIKDWKLTIVDTIADNASCGMYVLGNHKVNPEEVDLRQVAMTLSKDGEVVNSGLGSAVMGDPAEAVAWLAHCLGQYGVTLDAGDVVLSGALSAAVPALPGQSFACDFGDLGCVTVKFE